MTNCEKHEDYPVDCCPDCLAEANARSDNLYRALLKVRAQFAGYALRVAPNDAFNDVIIGTLDEAIEEGKRL